MKKHIVDLHDGYVNSVIDFSEGKATLLRDSVVKGLQIRLGKVRHAWQFYSERSDHGKRIYTCIPLGYFDRGSMAQVVVGGRMKGPVVTKFGEYIGPHPALHRADDHVSVEAARDKARVEAAKAITGTLPTGKRNSVKLGEAFEEIIASISKPSPVSAASPPDGQRTSGILAGKSSSQNGRTGHSLK